MTPNTKIMIEIEGERVQRINETVAIMEPAIPTGRQPYLFTRALAMGATKEKGLTKPQYNALELSLLGYIYMEMTIIVQAVTLRHWSKSNDMIYIDIFLL